MKTVDDFADGAIMIIVILAPPTLMGFAFPRLSVAVSEM